ncbi:aminotransferase class IV [Oceanispirochaeta sp.]|jgi:branched-chain amino acid aminotransferase|uniref:aminotransferase class IV n=1 Tax=Oceanispirochaeta sp. TaxID=2035350 RepID=UPI00262A1A57|nr:aminotransferase class IV [Oceanispirochaeta sp.]MDA3958872.1 aminotransferase class IV [Oceanispirochaeta sp.]
MAFTLSIYPWVYVGKFNESWSGDFIEQEHLSPEGEAALSQTERNALLDRRNSFPDLPLVNYTSQYGLGCFEGVKAFPQKEGGLKVFRPGENSARMARSMAGLGMPGVDEDLCTQAILGTPSRNAELGFTVKYDPLWEKDSFMSAGSVYIRPFSWSEPGIGVSLSKNPWLVVINTPVSAYFSGDNFDAVTTDMSRATPKGTGWIKCDANYVIPCLAKSKALQDGFMEAIFLDAMEHKYIEEGSSCNFFCLLKNGTLVTPELGDTILPGITRKSLIQLARDRAVSVAERKLPLEEVLADGAECFVTGTAAGLTPITSLTHEGKKTVFGNGKPGELSLSMQKELKGIQYGVLEDRFNWMVPVKS